ncbi:glycosyl transferase [Amaricoccus sp.]|uniref:glycosyl transferase n=1 Tax=Amaricoccus sp. TaxID=1872485 RepID=UPI002610CCC9|nr:glycosyl transferase [uncultured Amaricoccus sp.]
MLKQVICINWGTRYGPPYVNRLYAGVARHLTPPFTFTCFTDNADGIRREVRCEPLPPLGVAMPTGTKGIWPKARLWGARLGDLRGPVLFMDLDLVVTGPMDDFFAFGDSDEVILARNPSTPLEKLGQTSLFRFPVGKLLPLWERFRADPQGIADAYRFEQRFVTREAPGGIGFWPPGWVRGFRNDCARPFPLNYFLRPRLPDGTKVVIFPGGLLPPHAIAGHWGRHYRPNSRLGHLFGLFSPDRPDPPLRYLRHYLLPSDWVARDWAE